MPDNRSTARLAIHCEAVKVSYRQTKDGMVVSFAIHPNDMPSELALAPVGTRVVLAIAAIGDDEQPAPIVATPRAKRSEYDRRPFHTLSRAQQAGIKCSDAEFQAWLLDLDTPHSVVGSLLDGPHTELAAAIVRHHCRVKSRGEFDANEMAGARWDAFLARFDEACGRIAERR